MDYKAKYEQWCQDPIFDKETKAELSAIAGDEKEIEDRFYKDLSFGTGGLRGVIGAGTNRMNVYTVTKATQGLANYIKNRAARIKVWQSHLIPVTCLWNFLRRQRCVSMPTESRPIVLRRSDRLRSFPLP